MIFCKTQSPLQLAIPKGRIQAGVVSLLEAAGVSVSQTSREYRPVVSLAGFDSKILKPQNIVEMIVLGSRDIGFAGADWVRELKADVVELLDTKLDPVKIVAAAPQSLLIEGELPNRPLVIASEYEQITKYWIQSNNLDATFLKSFGATEVFPPEDADCIVDNTATGSTLKVNNLEIIDELMTSSTRLIANPRSLEDPEKRERIESLVLLMNSVLEARERVMLEVNVENEKFDTLVKILPAMGEPTVSRLYNDMGFSLKVAVPKKEVPELIPLIKAGGGTDILVTSLNQIVL